MSTLHAARAQPKASTGKPAPGEHWAWRTTDNSHVATPLRRAKYDTGTMSPLIEAAIPLLVVFIMAVVGMPVRQLAAGWTARWRGSLHGLGMIAIMIPVALWLRRRGSNGPPTASGT